MWYAGPNARPAVAPAAGAVERVPLTVDSAVRHARRVAAQERLPLVVRPRDAEVGKREVVEVEAPGAVDRELRVTALRARKRLAGERCRRGNPFERLAAVERSPDPARVRPARVGRADVEPVRVRGVDPKVGLEPPAGDGDDRRLPERRQTRVPRAAFRSRDNISIQDPTSI